MKSLLTGAALALALVAPAAAANLKCWTTQSIKTNSSPSGTYRNTATNTVDYIQAMNDGVSAMLAGLSAYSAASYAICMEGTNTTISGKKVWQLSAVVICPTNRVADNACLP